MKSAVPATLMLLALVGCSRGFFSARGTVVSDGGQFGAWRSTPQGCTRDPFDGRLPPDTHSVLSFLWEDPGLRDPKRDVHRPTAADAPLLLEVSRNGPGYSAVLHTVKNQGLQLDASVCKTLSVDAHEHAPLLSGGRPTLGGTFTLDCQVGDTHLSAHVRFDRCDF